MLKLHYKFWGRSIRFQRLYALTDKIQYTYYGGISE